jgi:hypothetical protein
MPKENNIQLVSGKYNGLFYLYDGEYYYVARFYKASYGEMTRVNSKDEATIFQIISL